MKWFEIEKFRPPCGELIWVWDMDLNHKFLIRYLGSQESWEESRYDKRFPIWAYLNDANDKSMNSVGAKMECQNCNKPTLMKAKTQKYCSPCNGIVNRRMNKERNRKK